MPVNLKAPNLGPRLSIVDAKGKRIARLGGENGPGLETGKFLAPHGIALDSKGDIYVGEVGVTNWKTSFPDTPMPPEVTAGALPAEAGENLANRHRRQKKLIGVLHLHALLRGDVEGNPLFVVPASEPAPIGPTAQRHSPWVPPSSFRGGLLREPLMTASSSIGLSVQGCVQPPDPGATS